MDETYRKALRAEALRQAANEAAWDARIELETELWRSGVPDEAAWLGKAQEGYEGTVTPEFTVGGFRVTDRRAFEEWCVARGFGRLEWVVDEAEVLDGCDAAGGLAYFDGEEVPGLSVLVETPNGVSLHPSKNVKQIVKEFVNEYLRETD